MERTIDKFKLNLTVNFPDREVDVCLHDARTLAEQQDVIAAIVEQYPQATSFLVAIVRVSHTVEQHPTH